MRHSLFLSTLFAVSMVGGAALAEKPQSAAAREPHVIGNLRAHGDTVNKVYRAPAAERSSAASRFNSTAARPAATPNVKNPLDRSASRINCADNDVSCTSSHSAARVMNVGAGDTGSGRYNVRPPAFLDKVLGSDRTDFNEAGLDEGMSARAANRVWSHAGHQGGDAKAGATLAEKTQVDRKQSQYQSSRVSCNEGDACSASSKDVKKEWAYAAIKAGTWTGPEKREPTNAARRIAAYRAAESASLHDEKAAQAEADRAHGHGSAAAAASAAAHAGDAH